MRTLDLHLRIYRSALAALPLHFRARYAEEMAALFEAELRSSEACWRTTIAESWSVLIAAATLRCTRQTFQVPALLVIAALATLVQAPSQQTTPINGLAAVDSVQFVATDPAGHFTITVKHGRAVRASVDRHELSRRQLVQSGDSIRVLNPRGRVLFAVAYDRSNATIQWEARPAACRGRALDCEIQQ